MEKDKFISILKSSKSKSDVCKKMSLPINGRSFRKVNNLIQKYNADISHFDRGRSKHVKYETVEKECPVCNKLFKTKKNHPREKTTCSHSCSNTYFRSSVNNPNWNPEAYRTTCFEYHDKKCIVCGEDKIVTVHHYDENNKNNNPENLVPLCPTHHTYLHSQHKNLISGEVDNYVENFIADQTQGGSPRLGRGH